MNNIDIDRILKKLCGEDFIGVYSRDNLPKTLMKKPCLLVANTDKKNGAGVHWIALRIDDYGGELFDSFGEEPIEDFRIYMDKHCKRWIYNDKQIQSIVSSVCGAYVIVYCTYRKLGYNLRRLVGLFTKDYGFNDLVVVKLLGRLMSF